MKKVVLLLILCCVAMVTFSQNFIYSKQRMVLPVAGSTFTYLLAKKELHVWVLTSKTLGLVVFDTLLQTLQPQKTIATLTRNTFPARVEVVAAFANHYYLQIRTPKGKRILRVGLQRQVEDVTDRINGATNNALQGTFVCNGAEQTLFITEVSSTNKIKTGYLVHALDTGLKRGHVQTLMLLSNKLPAAFLPINDSMIAVRQVDNPSDNEPGTVHVSAVHMPSGQVKQISFPGTDARVDRSLMFRDGGALVLLNRLTAWLRQGQLPAALTLI